MAAHSEELWRLAAELLEPAILDDLNAVANAQPVQMRELARLDGRLGGPGISTINRNGTGNYDGADREVFRPLQYCEMIFRAGLEREDLDWQARDIVEMAGLHLESLVKRIGSLRGLPLGGLLRQEIVKRRLDDATLMRLHRFAVIFNDSKHNVSHEKDTHLFSVSDAIVAYFVCRKQALALYQLARLRTDLASFE